MRRTSYRLPCEKSGGLLEDIPLGLELRHFLLQGRDLGEFRPHLAIAGKAVAEPEENSRIQRRKTLSATSRSRAACATATPLSVTNRTASVLNARLNLRVVISMLQFLGHDLIFMSTKPAAAHYVRGSDRDAAEMEGLGLEIFLDSLLRALAPETGGLDAAERRFRV